jgi:hypothetical protein
MTNKPELKGNPSPDISHLEIFEEGVNKLDFIYCQTKCPITGVFLSPSLSTSNNCDI